MSVSRSSSISDCTSDAASCSTPVGDPVIAVLSLLHTRLSWPMAKIALRLSVPTLAVEESLRLGISSPLLRAHFSTWAHESNEIPHGIPSALIASAIRHCDVLGKRSGGSCSTLDDGDDYDIEEVSELTISADSHKRGAIARLDPRLKDHFAFLQRSVGYNFMSILNDPTEMDASTSAKADWGSWFGSVVSDAFDYGTTPLHRHDAGSSESAAALLSRHPLHAAAFQPYLQYVGGVLERRRSALTEFHKWRDEILRVDNEGEESHDCDDPRRPWPTEVEQTFFSDTFSPADLMTSLLPAAEPSEVNGENTPTGKYNGRDVERHTAALESLDSACDEMHRSLLRVEHCLFVHVQKKSDEFFAASQSFEDLHSNAEVALKDLGITREAVVTCGDAVVGEFANVARLYRRRRHSETLRRYLEEVNTVREKWEYVESWLNTSDRSIELMPSIAKELIACQALIYDNESTASLMNELSCARSIPLRVSRGKAALIGIVTTHGTTGLCESLVHSTKGLPVEWSLVMAPLEAAATLGCLPQILQQYQQHTLDHLWLWTREAIASQYHAGIAASVRKLAAAVPHPKEERTAFLASIKTLKPAAYKDLIGHVLNDVQERISCIVAHWNDVRDYCTDLWEQQQLAGSSIAPSMANGSAAGSGDRTQRMSLPGTLQPHAFESLLAVAANHCVMDLVSVRYDENCSLRLPDAMPILRRCFLFVSVVESIAGAKSGAGKHSNSSAQGPNGATSKESGRGGGGSGGEFRSVLIGQCKGIFQRQHAKLQERVLQAVTTEERWEPVEVVDSTFQDMCTELCRRDETAALEFRRRSVDQRGDHNSRDDLRRPHDDGGGGEEEEEAVAGASRLYVVDPSTVLHGEEGDDDSETKRPHPPSPSTTAQSGTLSSAPSSCGFVVSHSLLLLLQTLHEYDNLLGSFPFLAFDVLGKMYEALKLYDGQCAAMVLGASAVDLGVLTSISIQNLALASQCTLCLAEFTCLFQKRLLHLFPSDKLSGFIQRDFDRARREFLAHRDEFYAKITSVVKERIDHQMSTPFEPVQWQRRGNEYVMGMLREMAKLLKTMRAVLRSSDIKAVMIPVVAYCTTRLRDMVRAVPPAVLADAREQVLSDIHLFKANTEKFGFLALRCMNVGSTVAAALEEPDHSTIDDWPSIESFQQSILTGTTT